MTHRDGADQQRSHGQQPAAKQAEERVFQPEVTVTVHHIVNDYFLCDVRILVVVIRTKLLELAYS